ncbi:unnamed protein product, partial [Protopolystoma xenopodis]
MLSNVFYASSDLPVPVSIPNDAPSPLTCISSAEPGLIIFLPQQITLPCGGLPKLDFGTYCSLFDRDSSLDYNCFEQLLSRSRTRPPLPLSSTPLASSFCAPTSRPLALLHQLLVTATAFHYTPPPASINDRKSFPSLSNSSIGNVGMKWVNDLKRRRMAASSFRGFRSITQGDVELAEERSLEIMQEEGDDAAISGHSNYLVRPQCTYATADVIFASSKTSRLSNIFHSISTLFCGPHESRPPLWPATSMLRATQLLVEFRLISYAESIDLEKQPLPRAIFYPFTAVAEQMSPGERQRLLLAAVCLRRPTLVFLDEATSQLSEEDEAQAYSSLAKYGVRSL